MNSNAIHIPPVPALDDFSFASDIDFPIGDMVNCNDDAFASNAKCEEVKQGQKRSSSLISEDESQSSASKSEKAPYFDLVDKAKAEGRIDGKKACRLRACLNSDDIILSLLVEQIPKQRKGKGYKCRICEVPVKGHVCQYCPVCSTSQKKIKKTDSHVCVNCDKCFHEGKKKKKLVQCLKQNCPCPRRSKGGEGDTQIRTKLD
eukprot:scaffold32243_cov166-Skeletonema_menzelii.AAC.3